MLSPNSIALNSTSILVRTLLLKFSLAQMSLMVPMLWSWVMWSLFFYLNEYSFPANDVVLYSEYKLSTPVTAVDPIPWNRMPSIPSIPSLGKAIGYGLTTDDGSTSDVLREVELNTVGDSVCTDFFVSSEQDQAELISVNSDQRSVCQGDSGGPLTVQDGSLLLGVTSFTGETCGTTPQGFVATSFH